MVNSRENKITYKRWYYFKNFSNVWKKYNWRVWSFLLKMLAKIKFYVSVVYLKYSTENLNTYLKFNYLILNNDLYSLQWSGYK